MPRKKSQPAKYSQSVNEGQNEGVGKSETPSHPGGSDGSQSDNVDDTHCATLSPKSEDSMYNSSTEHCRSDETLEIDESHLPSSVRRRSRSQEEESSLTDSVHSNPAKPEDILDNSSDFISKHTINSSTLEGSHDSFSTSISDLHEPEKPKIADVKSPMPRTLQEYVYRIIDIYYKQQGSSDAPGKAAGDMRDLKSDLKPSRNEENGDTTQITIPTASLQDALNSYRNGLKLVERLEQLQGSILNKPPLSLTVNENEMSVKSNGSISSDLDQCSTCYKVLKRSSMREHMDRHNNTGRYRCSVCMKAFSKLSSKEKHELIHTDQRPFKCDKCEKAYRQKIHLVEHMRSHTGERPYVCPHCNYSLASKSLLNRHIKTHEPATMLASEIMQSRKPDPLVLAPKKETSSPQGTAERRCIEPLKLKLQSRLQTNSQQASSNAENVQNSNIYKCGKCSSGFTSARRLSSHIHNVHKGSQPYPCPDCTKSFAHNSSLAKHRATEHGHRSLSLVQMKTAKKEPKLERPAAEDSNDKSAKTGLSGEGDEVPSKFPRLSVNDDDADLDSTLVIDESDCNFPRSDS